MPTPLDRLLAQIDTLDETYGRVDEALNAFRARAGQITDWQAFETCLARFYCTLENHLLRLDPPRRVDHWMDWGRCYKALQEEYGHDGEKTAFDVARTGKNGGLYGVLKAIALRVAGKCASNEIAARVSVFWSNLSVEEQFRVMNEYLAKYGHLWPSELTDGAVPRLMIEFHRALEEHPHRVQRMRRVGR